MSKGTISNSSIKIIPSDKLYDFILKLKDEKSMPENILNLYKKYSKDKTVKTVFTEQITTEEITQSEKKLLNGLISSKSSTTDVNFESFTFDEEKENKNSKKKNNSKEKKDLFLNLYDLKWLRQIVIKHNNNSGKTKIYLHELLKDSNLILPENDIIERNPILEERCKKLRQQQDRREYNAMTKNVDSRRKHFPEDTIAFQMKQINRHLIAVLQFVFSVAAGFAFGFIGVELIIGDLDFGFRLLLGIICSLIIALAEIYFLAKQLNEEYDIKEEPLINERTNKTQTHDSKLHKD